MSETFDIRNKMRKVFLLKVGVGVLAWAVLALIVGGVLSTVLPPLIAWGAGIAGAAVLAALVVRDASVEGRIVRGVFTTPIPRFSNSEWRGKLIETRERIWRQHSYYERQALSELLDVEQKISAIVEQILLYERNMSNRPQRDDIQDALHEARGYLRAARAQGNAQLVRKAQSFVRLQEQRMEKLEKINQLIESASLEISANIGTMAMAAATAGINISETFGTLHMEDTTNKLLTMQGQVEKINAQSTGEFTDEADFLGEF